MFSHVFLSTTQSLPFICHVLEDTCFGHHNRHQADLAFSSHKTTKLTLAIMHSPLCGKGEFPKPNAAHLLDARSSPNLYFLNFMLSLYPVKDV
jgi:hypothetical protein